jgi:hypothetical protein
VCHHEEIVDVPVRQRKIRPNCHFGGTTTHFLADDDETAVARALTRGLQLLPDNYVVIPAPWDARAS